jgi:hypothetical protein
MIRKMFPPAYTLLAISIVVVSFLTSVYVVVIEYNYTAEDAWHKTISKGYYKIFRDTALFITGYVLLTLFLLAIFRNKVIANNLMFEIALYMFALALAMAYPIICAHIREYSPHFSLRSHEAPYWLLNIMITATTTFIPFVIYMVAYNRSKYVPPNNENDNENYTGGETKEPEKVIEDSLPIDPKDERKIEENNPSAMDERKIDENNPPTMDERKIEENKPPTMGMDERKIDENNPPTMGMDERKIDENKPPQKEYNTPPPKKKSFLQKLTGSLGGEVQSYLEGQIFQG